MCREGIAFFYMVLGRCTDTCQPRRYAGRNEAMLSVPEGLCSACKTAAGRWVLHMCQPPPARSSSALHVWRLHELQSAVLTGLALAMPTCNPPAPGAVSLEGEACSWQLAVRLVGGGTPAYPAKCPLSPSETQLLCQMKCLC